VTVERDLFINRGQIALRRRQIGTGTRHGAFIFQPLIPALFDQCQCAGADLFRLQRGVLFGIGSGKVRIGRGNAGRYRKTGGRRFGACGQTVSLGGAQSRPVLAPEVDFPIEA
jgi:hypothetical protein